MYLFSVSGPSGSFQTATAFFMSANYDNLCMKATGHIDNVELAVLIMHWMRQSHLQRLLDGSTILSAVKL